MLRRLVQSFILGEATVGVSLVTLLLLGVRDWTVYANVLTVTGAIILFVSAAPLVGYRTHYRSKSGVGAIMGQVFIAVLAGGCSIGTAILFYMLRIAR